MIPTTLIIGFVLFIQFTNYEIHLTKNRWTKNSFNKSFKSNIPIMAGGKSLDPHYLLGIVNGDISHMNELPFMASLLYKSKTHFCGGSVWNSKFILTAAHCLYVFY